MVLKDTNCHKIKSSMEIEAVMAIKRDKGLLLMAIL
jgi:hypothetical protein